ncbi:MAG: hypothetical protein LBT92_00320 [Rickettsiales bacterium]|jgi:hypothetical protein|nr:hypothetical protein [Rickettsiales bacterium]
MKKLIISLLAVLAACGGNGGGDNNNPIVIHNSDIAGYSGETLSYNALNIEGVSVDSDGYADISGYSIYQLGDKWNEKPFLNSGEFSKAKACSAGGCATHEFANIYGFIVDYINYIQYDTVFPWQNSGSPSGSYLITLLPGYDTSSEVAINLASLPQNRTYRGVATANEQTYESGVIKSIVAKSFGTITLAFGNTVSDGKISFDMHNNEFDRSNIALTNSRATIKTDGSDRWHATYYEVSSDTTLNGNDKLFAWEGYAK